MPRICLSMIVKNEAKVIRRCLDSVRPHINSWLIVDTGSSDGTQDIIREHMNGVSGSLVERPWKNFAFNRNESLELAREFGDYVLTIDADDVLVVDAGVQLPPALSADGYYVRIELGENRYDRIAITRTMKPWRWMGVVHEVLVCSQPTKLEHLRGWTLKCLSGGARSESGTQKFLRDIEMLEAARAENPNDPRTVFYLAQSYRDAEKPEVALRIYRERVAMGGWDEEVFCARLQAARLLERLGKWAEAVEAYLEAYESRPVRAEPLYSLARHYRESRQFRLAAFFAEKAMNLPRPPDVLFVEEGVYRWRALDEYAVSAYWLGDYAAAMRANHQLLGSGWVPEEHRPRVQKNLEFCLANMA